jgi:hypothetical protein
MSFLPSGGGFDFVPNLILFIPRRCRGFDIGRLVPRFGSERPLIAKS